MYIVTIQNDKDTPVEIHNVHHKLSSGTVVQGINTIDSFTFTVLPGNPAFGNIHDFKTHVTVYNTNRNRYEFYGRVLQSSISMSEEGLIQQDVTCESYLGYLCDTMQAYHEEQNWTPVSLLTTILLRHNSRIEDGVTFTCGIIADKFKDENVYEGVQRESSWKTLREKLIDKLGAELRMRVETDRVYLDLLEEVGEHKTTEIALSRNMKSVTKETDPSAFITRLIPLGAKIGDSEERVDITSVHNGRDYIEDVQAIVKYGIHEGYVEFDDVEEPKNLLRKASLWLLDNNRVKVKYIVTALDLSLLGLDMDDFERGNYHPIVNALLGIDDEARIIKKTIEVCEETQSSFEIGDNFKTLSQLRQDEMKALNGLARQFSTLPKKYVTAAALKSGLSATEQKIFDELEGYAKTDELIPGPQGPQGPKGDPGEKGDPPTTEQLQALIKQVLSDLGYGTPPDGGDDNGNTGGDDTGGDDTGGNSGGNDNSGDTGGDDTENWGELETNDSYSEVSSDGETTEHFIDCPYLYRDNLDYTDDPVNGERKAKFDEDKGSITLEDYTFASNFPITVRHANPIYKVTVEFEEPWYDGNDNAYIDLTDENGERIQIAVDFDNGDEYTAPITIQTNPPVYGVRLYCIEDGYNQTKAKNITVETIND